MDTTIRKGTKSASITQSFALPQGIWDTTRPNGTVHTTYGYVGDDPLAMTADGFKAAIVDHNGYDVPCALEAPLFGQNRATLNPDENYPMIQRRYDRALRESLWARLHKLACPTATQD